jgi:murein DD-endopeptidase MepM/ murein hydrolase activator NlpD
LTSFGKAHRSKRFPAPSWARPGWKTAGVLAVLCSTVAWSSLPRPDGLSTDEQRQWQALGLSSLSGGAVTGMEMAPTNAAEPIEFAPKRALLNDPAPRQLPRSVSASDGPLRIRGIASGGLYWSLRSAGASPQVAAEYLSALATQIDVGEVGTGESFDLVLGRDKALLYAGLKRVGQADLQLVRWNSNGRSEWINAAITDRPVAVERGFVMPASGPVTSYFGYRYHPILHFTRFHAGIDIGASWGSPVVAAADGEVAAAGWAGGYGREVQIAHGRGVMSLYGHMSQIIAQPGSMVRAGQVIGYVGSSGLSTGPHLHFEVRMGGTPVNPLGVRFTSTPLVDTRLADAVKARLKALLNAAAA